MQKRKNTFKYFFDFGCFVKADNLISHYKEKYLSEIAAYFDSNVVDLEGKPVISQEQVVEYFDSRDIGDEESGPCTLMELIGFCYQPPVQVVPASKDFDKVVFSN